MRDIVIGIDTAQNNLGFAVVGISNKEIIYTVNHKVSKTNDILRNALQREFLEEQVSKIGRERIALVVIEAPAYGFKQRMVSIGTIHGAITDYFYKEEIDFVYPSPLLSKKLVLGKYSKKDDTKKLVMDKMNSYYNKDFKDNNITDALSLAFFGSIFLVLKYDREPKEKNAFWKRADTIFKGKNGFFKSYDRIFRF